MMRVTNSMSSTTLLGNLRSSFDRLNTLQNQVSSGKRILRASDDPIGTGRAIHLRSVLAGAEQYARNATEARTQLEQTDASLGTISKALQEAKRLGLSGANSATEESMRRQYADLVQQQIDVIFNEVNARHTDRQLFSGHQTDTVPVAKNPAGTPPFLYNGDDGEVRVPISDTTEVTTNLTARQILNLDGAADSSLPDVLTTLVRLKEDLESSNIAGIQDRLREIDGNSRNVISLRGVMGYKAMQMEMVADRLAETKGTVSEWLSQEEDVDLAETLSQLQMEQNVYQASLLATSRIQQPTLADFLR